MIISVKYPAGLLQVRQATFFYKSKTNVNLFLFPQIFPCDGCKIANHISPKRKFDFLIVKFLVVKCKSFLIGLISLLY